MLQTKGLSKGNEGSDWQSWDSYLTITEVDESGLVSGGLYEFALKQLAIKVHPRAAVLPGEGLATHVVGEESHVHAAHEQGGQLDPPRIEAVDLRAQSTFVGRGRPSARKPHPQHRSPPTNQQHPIQPGTTSKGSRS